MGAIPPRKKDGVARKISLLGSKYMQQTKKEKGLGENMRDMKVLYHLKREL
jgi:hypothetical protein